MVELRSGTTLKEGVRGGGGGGGGEGVEGTKVFRIGMGRFLF